MQGKNHNKEKVNTQNVTIKDEKILKISSDRETMQKIIISQDNPDFYYICSDEIKKDFTFVSFFINYIKSTRSKLSSRDEKAVSEAVSFYISNEQDEKKRRQIFSISCDTIRIIDDGYKIHGICNEICKLEYFKAMQRMEKSREKRAKQGRKTGLGFYYIRGYYKDYENIMEIFARSFINTIFCREDFSLEEEIHKEFNSPKDMYEYGIKNYLLNYIIKCDTALYAYLYARSRILDEKCKEVEKYLKRWDNYVKSQKEAKYFDLFDRLYEYIDDYAYENSSLCELEIIAYIANELGISKEIFKYDCCGCITSEEELSSIRYDLIEEQLKNNFMNRKMYNEIQQIFIEALCLNESEGNIHKTPTFGSARNDLTVSKSAARCKIISYDFKNHKKTE